MSEKVTEEKMDLWNETVREKKVICLNQEAKADYNFDEAIKTLRTNIQFCGSSIRTVMFTSAMPDEGKSDISFALAQSLAQIGRHTLVIDSDIRKSALLTRFHLDLEVNGLSQYLSGQRRLEEIIYDTDTENLSVVFAGPYSPNATELLEEPLFVQLIEYAHAHYDYIILDTAPLGALIDAAIVAGHCDGVVMVIESDAISRRLEQRVQKQLEKSGCRILGVVLNKVDMNQNRYYGKYGKYGHYGNYANRSGFVRYDGGAGSGNEEVK